METYYQRNREKCLKQVKEWQSKNKKRLAAGAKKRNAGRSWTHWQKRLHYKRTYGITLEQYNEMVKAQNGRCANKACNKHESELSRALHIDHCHITGKIRGLLCRDCNTALGFAKDSEQFLQGLINYLKATF